MSMREIKFRAWDKKRRIMTRTCNLLLDPDGYIYWQFGYNTPEFIDQDDYELMMLTGCKDHLDNDIWEGDILRIRSTYEMEEDEKPIDTVSLVEYRHGGFRTSFYNIGVWMPPGGNWFIEVIGNIHEDPELLEEAANE